MEEIRLKNYAHLGDAVWELHIREKSITETSNTKALHDITTKKVCAKHQAELLKQVGEYLTVEEKELVRRARNLQVPISRRSNQSDYRQATSFEALIGYLYMNDKVRLKKILTKLNQ